MRAVEKRHTEQESEPEDRRRRRATRTARASALVLALVAATACQTYEPRPLEPRAHRETWHARTLEESSLHEFLARLERAADLRATAFDATDGLSLREAQVVALAFSPKLRLARLRAGRAEVGAQHAGRWGRGRACR